MTCLAPRREKRGKLVKTNWTRRTLALCAATWLILGTVSTIGYAAPDPMAEARKHFARGIELVDDGAIAQAVVEFRRAYEIKPHYAALYNLGQALIQLGEPIQAIEVLERYLKDGGAAIAPERRQQVEADLRTQRERIAILQIDLSPAGAAVLVDGKRVGTSPLPDVIRVGVGTHSVAASRDGFVSAEMTVNVVGEEHRVVELRLLEATPAGRNPYVSPTEPRSVVAPKPGRESSGGHREERPQAVAQPSDGDTQRAISFVLGGVGVVSLGIGAGLGLKAQSQHSEALKSCTPECDAIAQQNQDIAKENAKFATIAFVAGGASLLAAVVLFLTAPSGAENGDGHTQVTALATSQSALLEIKGRW